jgi:hypothetical protein
MKRETETSGRGPVADRRNFLKLAGAGIVGAGAAAVAVPAVAEETKTDAQGGYRESEHVKRYYALAREF